MRRGTNLPDRYLPDRYPPGHRWRWLNAMNHRGANTPVSARELRAPDPLVDHVGTRPGDAYEKIVPAREEVVPTCEEVVPTCEELPHCHWLA